MRGRSHRRHLIFAAPIPAGREAAVGFCGAFAAHVAIVVWVHACECDNAARMSFGIVSVCVCVFALNYGCCLLSGPVERTVTDDVNN